MAIPVPDSTGFGFPIARAWRFLIARAVSPLVHRFGAR
jgi:hypothetical protein